MTHALQSFNVPSSPARNTSLQKAIEEGDLRAIQVLVKQGSPVNSLLPSKELPLHAVVRSVRFPTNQDKIEAVRLFIQSGANFEAKDIDGLTALDHAIHLQNIPLAKVMIGEKIGIASEIIKNQVEIKRTSDSLADITERLQQKTAVDPNTLGSFQKAAYEGNVEELKKAVKNKQSNASMQPRLNQLDKHGLAPIHYAVLGNQEDAFQTLLTLGADPKVLTRDKDTIIHLTAANKSPSLLKKALESKVDLNFQNIRGETALHYAFLHEHWETIQTLMQKGADPLIADLQGISPPAAFVSMSMLKDPLLISSKDLVQTIFEVLFLWQLQSQNLETLSQFRSWPAALTASFFGVLAAKAMPLIKQKQMSSIASLAKECIPGLGLGWTAKRTYHSFSGSFQKVTRSWNYLGYRTLDALPSLVMESLAAITNVALIGMQATVHANVLRPRQETGLSALGIPSGNSDTGSFADSVIRPQSDPAYETLSLLADIPHPIPETLKDAMLPKTGSVAQWFIGILRKPTLSDLHKPSIDLRGVVAPKPLTYQQKDIEQEEMFPNIGSVYQWFIDTLHKTSLFALPKSSIDLRSAIVPTFPQGLNIRMPNDQHPQTEIITQLPGNTSKRAPFPPSSIYQKHTVVPTELHQQANNRTQNTPYRAEESFVNFGPTIQPKIDPEKEDPSLTGKADEEGRLRQVATNQNSKSLTVFGSESAIDASNFSYLLKTPQNVSDIHSRHVDTTIAPPQQKTPKTNFAPYAIKIGSPFLLKFLHNTYNWISNLFSGAVSTTSTVTDSSRGLPQNDGKDDSKFNGKNSPKPDAPPFIFPIDFGGSQLSLLGRSSSMPDLLSYRQNNRLKNLEKQIFSQSGLIFTSEEPLRTATTLNEKKRADSSSSSTHANGENIAFFDETREREMDSDLRHSLESYLPDSSTVPQPSPHTPEDSYRNLRSLVSPTLLLLQPQDDLQGEATPYPVPVPSNLDNLDDLEAAQQPESSVNANPQQDHPLSLENLVNAFSSSPALSTIEDESLEEENYQVTIATLFDEAENPESNQTGRIASPSYDENIASQKENSDIEENTISSPPQMRRPRSLSSESSAVPTLSRSSSGSSVYDFAKTSRVVDRFDAHLQPNPQSFETLTPGASDTPLTALPASPDACLIEREEENSVSNSPQNSDRQENTISSRPRTRDRSLSFSLQSSTPPPAPRTASSHSVHHFTGVPLLADPFNAQPNQSQLLATFVNASDTQAAPPNTPEASLVEREIEEENSDPDTLENPLHDVNIASLALPSQEQEAAMETPSPVPVVSSLDNDVHAQEVEPRLAGLFNAPPQLNHPQSLETLAPDASDTRVDLPTTPATSFVERDNDQGIATTPLIEEESFDPNTIDTSLPVENIASPTPILPSLQAESQAQASETENTPQVLVPTSVDNSVHVQDATRQPNGQVNGGSQRNLSLSLGTSVDAPSTPSASRIQGKKLPKRSRSKSDVHSYSNRENNDPNSQPKSNGNPSILHRKLNREQPPSQAQKRRMSTVEKPREEPPSQAQPETNFFRRLFGKSNEKFVVQMEPFPED